MIMSTGFAQAAWKYSELRFPSVEMLIGKAASIVAAKQCVGEERVLIYFNV